MAPHETPDSAERILAAVRQLTIEQGWNKVRLSAVAKHAGVSRPLVYKLFGDKQHLGWALVVRAAEGYMDILQHLVRYSTATPQQTIALMIHGMCVQAQNDPLLAPILNSEVGGGTSLIGALTTNDDRIRMMTVNTVIEWVHCTFPDVSQDEALRVVDHMVRCGISFVLNPPSNLEASCQTLGGLAAMWLSTPAAHRSLTGAQNA